MQQEQSCSWTHNDTEPAKEMVWRNIMLHLATRIPEKFRGYTMMDAPKSAYEYLDYIILNLHPSVVQEAINDMRSRMKTMASGDFRNLARYTKDLCTIEILVNMSLFSSEQTWGRTESTLINIKTKLLDIPTLSREVQSLIRGTDTSFD